MQFLSGMFQQALPIFAAVLMVGTLYMPTSVPQHRPGITSLLLTQMEKQVEVSQGPSQLVLRLNEPFAKHPELLVMRQEKANVEVNATTGLIGTNAKSGKLQPQPYNKR